MIDNKQNLPVVSRKIRKADKYINAEYVRKLYEAIDNPRDKAYIMLHIETGLRVSDIVGIKEKNNSDRLLGIEIDRIDFKNFSIEVYDHKKNKWRFIYFPNKVKPILKMWLRERQIKDIKGRALFPFSEKTANRILKYWCKKVGYPLADRVSSHFLRHTFIRLSRRAGRDIKAVQQNTGDTVKTILAWYSELDSEGMKEELDKDLIGGV